MNNSLTRAISYTTAKQSIQLHIFYALPQVSSCVSSHCSSPSVPLLFSLMWDISSGSWFSHCCSRSFTSPTLGKKPRQPPPAKTELPPTPLGTSASSCSPTGIFPFQQWGRENSGCQQREEGGKGMEEAIPRPKPSCRGRGWPTEGFDLAHHSWTPGRSRWRWSGRAGPEEPRRWQLSGCCPAPRISSAALPATAGHSRRTGSWSPAACNSQEKAAQCPASNCCAASFSRAQEGSSPLEWRVTWVVCPAFDHIPSVKIWDISLAGWLTRMLNQVEGFNCKTNVTINHSSFK